MIRDNQEDREDREDNGSDFSRISDIELLARWLDTRFSIPGTGIRFGLDSLIGLIPGVGDASTAVIGLYLITRAWREGASFWVILRMLWNMLLDFLFGSIPLVGDIFDVVFRSNTKNARLLHRHLEKRAARNAARQNSESAAKGDVIVTDTNGAEVLDASDDSNLPNITPAP